MLVLFSSVGRKLPSKQDLGNVFMSDVNENTRQITITHAVTG